MKKLFVTLALCGALLIGGFAFWQSAHAGATAYDPYHAHAGATAFCPFHAHAGATTYVPTHKQGVDLSC